MRFNYVVYSVIIHGVLTYLLWHMQTGPFTPKEAPLLIEFREVQEHAQKPESVAPPVSSKTGSRDKKTLTSSVGKKTFQQLQKALRNPVWGLAEEKGSGDEMFVADDVDGSVGGEKYFSASIELKSGMQAIWTKIRTHIHYHSDFYIDSLQGDVHAKVLIGKRGRIESLSLIQGKEELAEWVKMALSRALAEDYLEKPLSKKLFLHLTFHFAILPYAAPVQDFKYNYLNLRFNIFGFRNLEGGLWQAGKSAFAEQKMHRVSEWNFSKSLEVYRDACYIRRNREGCRVLIENYAKLALHSEVEQVKLFMRKISSQSEKKN